MINIPRKIFWAAFIFLAIESAGYGFDLTTVAFKLIPQFEKSPIASSHKIASNGNFDQCREVFFKGLAPIIPKEQAQMTRPLCFDGFAVLYSSSHKIPLFAAEVLTRESVQKAKGQTRTNIFFPDARLPFNERASLEDFKSSGYDRGHNFPAADANSPNAMAQSFSLANMMPQAPENNRGVWADYEKATRKYATRAKGNVYIITGSVVDPKRCALLLNAKTTLGVKGVPLPDNDAAIVAKAVELSGGIPRHYSLKQCSIGNGVTVPTFIYKLVFDSSSRRAWAYWAENTNTAVASAPISYAELVKRTGINFLPEFNSGIQNSIM